MIVAIESDGGARERHEPGPDSGRPITPATERAEIIAALAAVDYVIESDSGAVPDLIARLAPDVIVRWQPRPRRSSYRERRSGRIRTEAK